MATRGVRDVPELAPGIPIGYLAGEARPDSLSLLPPPPLPGSPAMTFDEEVRIDAIALRGSERWKQAALDSDLGAGNVLRAFECALGTATGTLQTPRLYQMMQRVMVDSGFSTIAAKTKYQRQRPFVLHDDGTCTPELEVELRTGGSYPSGHAAIGWAAALVLAQLVPARADRLLARGRSFGESRIFCNAHWVSDVTGGQTMGAATVTQLKSTQEFLEDLTVASEELIRTQVAGTRPVKNCGAEERALSTALEAAY